MEKTFKQLTELSRYLSGRREQLMKAWRMASEGDPQQTTVDSLTRTQFYDHIPQVLDVLEEELKSWPGGEREAAAKKREKREEIKHGLQRWQQGYRLSEVTREWGHLHLCLTGEVEAFAKHDPEIERETVAEAQCVLVKLINNAINESVSQYMLMEKETATGRARDLEHALAELAEVERQRGMLIREAVHDLGGSVQAVTTAATILSLPTLPEDRRSAVTGTIERGVKSLRMMLGELMSLARLEAGEERRKVETFDAAEVLGEFCAVSQTTAKEHGLWLEASGPRPMEVEGDSDKVHRIAQNLVQNALKYTKQGGVTVSWGLEGTDHWWLKVKDTGPGLLGGPGAPMLNGLKEATASARESDENAVQAGGEGLHVLPQVADAKALAARQRPGEGIGLAIVKRLCDLLDASLEVASSAQEGTTFRVLLPVRYETDSRAS